MSNKIALHFLRGWGHYNAKDVAGFDPDHAEALIKQGYAKKAAAQPEAKGVASLDIDMGAAMAKLRAEIGADASGREAALTAREADLIAQAEALSAREVAVGIRLDDLIKREADLEARIAAMSDEDTLIVDADGVVIETVEEDTAKPAKPSGLPKQGK